MILNLAGSLLIFVVTSIGLAWPIAVRLAGANPERILAAVSLSLVAIYLFAWAVYVFALPTYTLWVLPLMATLSLARHRRELADAWHERDARELIVAQSIVTTWCLCWLALVITYSGGGWAGDWFGHWQRTAHFLNQGPPDVIFNGFDPLTSRPPLVNVVVGAFAGITQNDFAHYQLAMTFLGSMSFMPAALLARRFGDPGAAALLAVLLMVNPMFVQNTTFAWTKLPAAFFVLAAAYYFIGREACSPTNGILCATMTAAALLAHYSAGPYAVLLAGAWMAKGWRLRSDRRLWQETALSVAAGFGLLSTWFAWSIHQYGISGTLLTNTSVTGKASTFAEQAQTIALNIRDTFVPHFLRNVDYSFLAQSSPWGWWRDWFFQLYQVNFFFVFGSTAWIAMVVAFIRVEHLRTLKEHALVACALLVTATLGIAVVSARDTWGLAHICLQPLGIAGIALLAGSWHRINVAWKRLVLAGATLDFVLGIALQFGVQSFLIDRWLAPNRSPSQSLEAYTRFTRINHNAKEHFDLVFVGDWFASYHVLILACLGVVFAGAMLCVRRFARVDR